MAKVLRVENQCPNSIQLFVAESANWAIADKVAQVGEYAAAVISFNAAVDAFLAAYVLAAPELAAEAPSALPFARWIPENWLTVINRGREIINEPAGQLTGNLLVLWNAASAMIQAIPKVSLTLPAQSPSKDVLSESFWSELFNPSGWAEFDHIESLLMMVYDPKRNKLLYLTTENGASWVISGEGAHNLTSGNFFDWDGIAITRDAPTFIANSDSNGGLTVLWPNADGGLSGARLDGPSWRRCWPTGDKLVKISGLVAAAYYDGQLQLGCTRAAWVNPDLGFPAYMTGTLENLNVHGSIMSDYTLQYSDFTGVAFAISAQHGLHAAYCYNNKTLMHAQYKRSEPISGVANFSDDYSRIFVDRDQLTSLHCPAIAWFAPPNSEEKFYLAVETDTGVVVYTMELAGSTTTRVGEPIAGASAPSFLVYSNDLLLAYRSNGKVWLKSCTVDAPPTVLLDFAPLSPVAFGYTRDRVHAAFHRDDSRIYVMTTDNLINWNPPKPLPDFVDPKRPAG